GELAPNLLRTSAGFHALKLIDRREASAFSVTQTHARHILLRPSPQLSQDAAMKRLADFKRQIMSRSKTLEQLARENAGDGGAPRLSHDAAMKRLADFKRQIMSRSKTFEQLARENSEDGSAPSGGDLGW